MFWNFLLARILGYENGWMIWTDGVGWRRHLFQSVWGNSFSVGRTSSSTSHYLLQLHHVVLLCTSLHLFSRLLRPSKDESFCDSLHQNNQFFLEHNSIFWGNWLPGFLTTNLTLYWMLSSTNWASIKAHNRVNALKLIYHAIESTSKSCTLNRTRPNTPGCRKHAFCSNLLLLRGLKPQKY